MAKIKSLFAKKKEETDGQEEFFKEDFAPVAKKPATKKPAAKVEKATPKTAAKVEKAAPKTEKKAEPKKSASKAAPKAEKATPKTKATAKKAETKPTAKAEKPAAKAPSKKAEPKKPAAKAASKTEKAAPKAKTTKAQTQEIGDDSPVVKGAVAVKSGKEQADGKWEIRRAKDGRYFFALYASNHTIIAYSQIYSSTTAVTTGINSVIANAAKAETEDTTLKKVVSLPCPKWEIYLDKAEQYRFRLYAPNGLCICHSSHGYATKGGCKGGIESIKRFASEEASVDKSYLK